jgi:hypothetical protein
VNLKGLQLIAQFKFQRAAGVKAPENLSVYGTKKLSADKSLFSASEIPFLIAEDYPFLLQAVKQVFAFSLIGPRSKERTANYLNQ